MKTVRGVLQQSHALIMATWQRRPKAGLIVYSDRGSQYASKQYCMLLKKHRFVGNMSRIGNCWDYSVAESFFGWLKGERVIGEIIKPDGRQNRIFWITLRYFIIIKDCIHLWDIKAQTSLKTGIGS